jgi:hypothetical protein
MSTKHSGKQPDESPGLWLNVVTSPSASLRINAAK